MIFERNALIEAMMDFDDPDFELAISFFRRAGVDLQDEGFPLEKWCLEQAERGKPEAQHAIAKLFQSGIFGNPDQVAAYRWCSRAVESGYVPALHMLAGLEVDQEKSIELFEAAARLDYAPALVALATTYLTEDFLRAREYLERAVALGDSVAEIILGNLLIENSVPSETIRGLRLIEASAFQGNATAHGILSNLYAAKRFGIPVDLAKSTFHRHEAEVIKSTRNERLRPYSPM
ncbi:MAG: hypothetical protein V4673_08770 [Pseudomonadota bacterium]